MYLPGYRIVMQGYWLEGGSTTFYFQPFYRWITGLLHAVFGESSVGELFWDGACLLAGSLFSFRVTRAYAGFRWGLVAAALTLGVFVFSNAADLIGRGLGEIASAGLLGMAALCDPQPQPPRAHRAGGRRAAVLAFYTRLEQPVDGSWPGRVRAASTRACLSGRSFSRACGCPVCPGAPS
jgi:hypothetical protein